MFLLRGLARLSHGIYAFTMPASGGEPDPEVGALLWAPNDEVATIVYDSRAPISLADSQPRADDASPPPPSLFHVPDLHFATIWDYEHPQRLLPQLQAAYSFPEGMHRYTKIGGTNRAYYFGEVNLRGVT